MTVGQIREALFQPGARITPGYEVVTVQLRDGRAVRGFARNRSNLTFACRLWTGNSTSFTRTRFSPSMVKPNL